MPSRLPFRVALVGALAVLIPTAPLCADALRNWFNDPFFQVTSALPDCPLPAGPFVDERGRREQAHRRAEKGTTCWLAGECSRPQAYAYDAEIAEAVRATLQRDAALAAGTTLWITVQGRVVYVEGCASGGETAGAVEAAVRALPHVQQAVAILRTDAKLPVPYRLRTPP